mmetsp:Transcript_660/g.1032  ORF Transcript_660/g.1032 Transcript_660/m.1032 type:complete len:82 (+) Transcript_660:885-1130(+)
MKLHEFDEICAKYPGCVFIIKADKYGLYDNETVYFTISAYNETQVERMAASSLETGQTQMTVGLDYVDGSETKVSLENAGT